MGKSNSPRLGRRPVFIADYQAPAPADKASAPPIAGSTTTDRGEQEGGRPAAGLPIRHHFPAAGEEREGGRSDGYCYRVNFAAGRLEATYEMVRAFLHEHGYRDLPLPADAAELRRFRLPPKLRHQLSFFGDNGYVHNPIKILFPVPAGRRGALIVELYNEHTAGHLLRFHRLE